MASFAFLDHSGPIAFAHRGGALEAFENTWESFEHARRLGYFYIETDVHATADEIVVTIHDPTLDRVAGRPGVVRYMSWSELSEVRVGGPSGESGGHAVPRLDELLTTWPELRWNIDLKHDTVVVPLVETLKRVGALDRVCVTSFNDRRLAWARGLLGPEVCTAPGAAVVGALRAASLIPGGAGAAAARLALRRFDGLGTGFGAVQVPEYQGRVKVTDRQFVAAAHRAGLQVHVWTVDDEDQMERLLDLDVDGLMTDRPCTLKAVLERRGAWTR